MLHLRGKGAHLSCISVARERITRGAAARTAEVCPRISMPPPFLMVLRLMTMKWLMAPWNGAAWFLDTLQPFAPCG